MSDFPALNSFFDAWGDAQPDIQAAAISGAISESFTYADPRSGDRIKDLDALCAYVAMFAANAPGWTASVVKADESCGYVRVVVAFGGQGPDGSDMIQHGTYFAELDSAGKIQTLAGFVGAGGV